MPLYTCGIQMTKKRFRIITSVSEEEYKLIKELAGIATLSAFMRSKALGKEREEATDSGIKKWVDFLMTMDDRDEMLDNIKRNRDLSAMQYAFRHWLK